MDKPTIFVGSSSEALPVARAVKRHLMRFANVHIWDEADSFPLNQSTLESLVAAKSSFHFAVFILAADDPVTVRGNRAVTPRDNVLFELGLFMGHLDRHRTLALFEEHRELRTLTDFLGISVLKFRMPPRGAPDFTKQLANHLSDPCNAIRRHVKRVMGNAVDPSEQEIVLKIAALGGRMVYLLLEFEKQQGFVQATRLGKVLCRYANKRGAKREYARNKKLWKDHAQICSAYLEAHGCVERNDHQEFKITALGQRLLKHPETKRCYRRVIEGD